MKKNLFDSEKYNNSTVLIENKKYCYQMYLVFEKVSINNFKKISVFLYQFRATWLSVFLIDFFLRFISSLKVWLLIRKMDPLRKVQEKSEKMIESKIDKWRVSQSALNLSTSNDFIFSSLAPEISIFTGYLILILALLF